MRPTMSGKGVSYAEVRDHWTLEELYNFCELLDIEQDLEYEANQRSSK